MHLLNHFIKKEFDIHEDALLLWRKRIFFTIFLIAILVGALSYIPNMKISFQSGKWLNALVYTIIYLFGITVTFVRVIPFKLRAWSGLLLFYSVGLISLLTIGPVGSGRIVLFAFAILTCLLLGLKAAVIALILNVCTFFLVAWLLYGDYFEFSHLTDYTATHWVANGLTFLFMSTVITVSLGVFVAVLEKNLKKEQSLTTELKLSNEQLERENNERRLVEESLRKSRERYRTLTNNLHVGIYRNTVGHEGKFLEANPAILKMFGFQSRNEFLKINVSDLYQNPDERNAFNEKMLRRGFVRNEELNLKKKDGTYIICSLSAVAVKDEKGEVKYYDGVIEDITKRKQLEAQFQQAQKMEAIGTLAGGIAHDFNNLLMIIQGNVSLMLFDLDSSHPHYEHLENIENQLLRGSDLTSKLLGYARKGKYNFKLIDLNQIVRETSDTFGRTRKEILIQQEFADDLFPIEADHGQIEQVLLNMFINAADAMPKGGQLILKTKNTTHANMTGKLYEIKQGRYVLLSVADTGIGMDREVRDRIFEPFFTTKEMGKGTGLGLASVYGIVKSHGGYIEVESEQGLGTTFSIYLPASDKKISKTKEISAKVEDGNETILLVDDEKLVLDMGTKMLKKLGYTVFEAGDGETAIKIFKENYEDIDLVMLDMIMPGMGGGEVYDQIRKINSDVKVLLSSGYSVDGQATEILQRGCDGFIQKPFGLEDLSNKLKRILAN